MMRRISIGVMLLVLALAGARTSEAAFVIGGGENGWQLSTDGIVDVFATYDSTSNNPGGKHDFGLLDAPGQRFGIGVGLLPSVVGINVKAPTVDGVESSVRIGIYPSIQNTGNGSLAGSSVSGGAATPALTASDRFSVGPNIDFREIFYTAKGKYGELLAGRALNLYQGKNILTDMTLLGAGTVGLRAHTVTLGHIGWGYLYTGFGPQIRYTTPDMAGTKVAVLVGEPYDISGGDKTNAPRIETEISYAKASGSMSVQAWVSSLYQTATATATGRVGKKETSMGGAYGAGVGIGGLNLLGSGYYGQGLGTVSVQDGAALSGLFGGSTDANGVERTDWGFLAQATYQISSSWKVGANYGQTRQEETGLDQTNRISNTRILVKKQESAVAQVAYNLNKFTQFVAEYIYGQSTWMDGATQHSNQVALGTLFFW
jgi:hypothetical protein